MHGHPSWKVIFIATIAISATTRAANDAARFDTSALGAAEGNIDGTTKKSVVLEIKPTITSEQPILNDDKVDLNALEARIRSFAKLVETARDQTERARFLINLASTKLQKARMLTVTEETPSPEAEKEARTLMASAAQDASNAANVKELEAEGRAYALYLSALGQIGRDKKKQTAAESLHKAIQLAPHAAFSSGIIFYLGESYYEDDAFEQAIKTYKDYMSLLNDDQKILARYKTAWCYIGLQELRRAEEMFIGLIKDPNSKEVGQNSVKELAYVTTQVRNEAGVVLLANSLFGDDTAKKSEFLSSAWTNLQRMKGAKRSSVVFESLMKLTSGADKRLQLRLDDMRAARKPYASAHHYASFISMQREIDRLGEDKRQTLIVESGDTIALEVEQLIRSYVDTYTEKQTNSEKVDRKTLADSLKSVFAFHAKNLTQSKNRVAIQQLWLNLCIDEKDDECVDEIANRVAADPALKTLRAEASNAQLAALDNLARKDKSAWLPKLTLALQAKAPETSSPQWAEINNRLADLYVQERTPTKAIPLLASVYVKDRNENTFFRLQMARYLSGQYQKVVRAKPPHGVPVKGRLQELVREASLKLAEANTSSGSFQDYEANIHRFLALNQDKSKETIVLRDYVQKLLSRGESLKAAERLRQLPDNRFSSPENQSLVSTVAIRLIQDGQFAAAVAFIFAENKRLRSKNLLHEGVLAKIGNGGEVPFADLQKLDANRKQHILGVLAVARPGDAIRFLEKFPSQTKPILSYGYLALQVSSRSLKPKINSRHKSMLAAVIPQDGPTEAEKLAAKATFPASNATAKVVSKNLEKTIPLVRDVRKQVVADLNGRDAEVQERVLKTAISLEEKTAITIEMSPVPEGLSGAKKSRYMQDLSEAAREFRDQAKEFRKVLETVRSGNKDGNSRSPASVKKTWPWPTAKDSEEIRSILVRKGLAGALIAIDLRKAAGSIDESDYHTIRSGCLLAATEKNEAVKKYVLRELELSGQRKLIETWKGL